MKLGNNTPAQALVSKEIFKAVMNWPDDGIGRCLQCCACINSTNTACKSNFSPTTAAGPAKGPTPDAPPHPVLMMPRAPSDPVSSIVQFGSALEQCFYSFYWPT